HSYFYSLYHVASLIISIFFLLSTSLPSRSSLFPYTTLFRSWWALADRRVRGLLLEVRGRLAPRDHLQRRRCRARRPDRDRRGRAAGRWRAVGRAAHQPRDRAHQADQGGHRQRWRLQRQQVRRVHRLSPRAAPHPRPASLTRPERRAGTGIRIAEVRAPLPDGDRRRADPRRRG